MSNSDAPSSLESWKTLKGCVRPTAELGLWREPQGRRWPGASHSRWGRQGALGSSVLKKHPDISIQGCVYSRSFTLRFKLVGYRFSSAVLPSETGTFMRVGLRLFHSSFVSSGSGRCKCSIHFQWMPGCRHDSKIENKRALRNERKASGCAVFWVSSQDPLGTTLVSVSRALPAERKPLLGALFSPESTHIVSNGTISCIPSFCYRYGGFLQNRVN